MIKKCLSLFIIFYSFSTVAQIRNLPSNPEGGKCYIRCLEYDKKAEWKEAKCDSLRQADNTILTREEAIKREQKKLKMLAYQKRLKSLGYDVDINGIIDDKTFIAHNKYLKRKKKEARKQKRKERT